jgi:hypothetical protein
MKPLLLLLALLLCSTAWSASDAEIERSIDVVLSQRHPKETAAWWRNLGPTAPRVMISIHRKTDDTFRKVRLTEALGWFPESPEALAYLKELAIDSSSDDVVRTAAVRGVARAKGAEELDFLAGFLKHADPQTRLAAAESIRKLDDPRARERLDDYLKTEKAGWLVARVKGETVKPSRGLVAVSSSEDRVNPEFEGEWKGFWIAPRAGVPAAGAPLESRPAALSLKIRELVRLEGKLSVRPLQGDAREWTLEGLASKGPELSAKLTAPAPTKGEPVAARGESVGELVTSNGTAQLVLRNAGTGGVFVLKREPK